MGVNQETLKKFMRQTKLRIVSIEDDSSTNTKLLKVTLAEPLAKVVSSNVTDTGAPIFATNVKELTVAEDDIEKFYEGCEDDGDTLVYSGNMKLDVSRPNGRMVNGNFVITKPAKAWLVSVAFNRRGATMQQDKASALSSALKALFGDGGQSAAAVGAPASNVTSNNAGTGKQPVDTTKPAAQGQKTGG